MSHKINTDKPNNCDELIEALIDSAEATRDQTRAIDELVLSNDRILDELIAQRHMLPDESEEPATYLNGRPRG